MKNSKYSNFAGSKYTVAFTEDVCEEHEGLPFTNFCSAITCVRPLCPECVQNHSNHHRSMRSQPEMHSFKTLKNQCVNKIASILERVQITENEGAMNEINAIFENTLYKIREMKENSKRIVDSYYISLEESVKKKMVGLMSEQSDLFQELDKANNIINELKLLVHRLDNSRDFISSAQTIVRLDSDKIQDKVKSSYSTVKNLKEHYKVNFHVEKGYEQKLVTYLSKLAFYGQYSTNDVVPRITEQIMTKNSMKVLGKSTSQDRLSEERREAEARREAEVKAREQQRQISREREKQRERQKQRQKERQRDDDRKSTVSRRSTKSANRIKKNIIGMNTFKESSPHKYLHFFQNDENILQYLDLESEDTNFSSIDLDITFKVPQFHKSIATPSGDLYLVGGSLSNNLKSQKIYKYDFIKNTLTYCNSLKYGRSSHSICFNNKYIYVLGGILNNQVITNRCERYDIISNKVQEIKPMLYEACSFACCSFNGRYIYKIGGICDDNSISSVVEVYDQKEGEWSVINLMLQGQGDKLIPLGSNAATQITQNQIMVMGGYNEANLGQKQTYILRVDSTGTYIRDINTYPLPFAEGFWNNIPIIQNKLVFALQNVSQGQDQCIENYRKILVFDGQGWKCLNN